MTPLKRKPYVLLGLFGLAVFCFGWFALAEVIKKFDESHWDSSVFDI